MALEVYDKGRYFTVTRDHLKGTPKDVLDCNKAYLSLEKQYLLKASPKKKNTKTATIKTYNPKPYSYVSDVNVIQLIRKSRDSQLFNTLFDKGDISAFDDDNSKADFALCSLLAKHCHGDPEQIERIFSSSALAREKWLQRDDYRKRTIDAALMEVDTTYQTHVLESQLKDI